MKYVLFFYGFLILLLIFIGIISWKFYDKRKGNYKKVPEGFLKTDEVFIDPTTNKTLRVYYNKENGKRIHVEE
ncbi:hypothetical protein Desor_3814 [Desulfosporosinus orientis DSM 765]|uniref:Uncharacterized protein n=1 Tax=Desulfosporosinus orientis (strain ATCC 19365 / DSM 765 / NCIMB 8382 / VKM B-1628 / Singapore I) TaxID=768706 RepID=G7W9D7_DESOD|nr:hypothetical protein [Desulfosporosinus orientis]AET69274.1 hypothetical protein Desor_3814 [Desulfosporosinus orientis DSM 765]